MFRRHRSAGTRWPRARRRGHVPGRPARVGFPCHAIDDLVLYDRTVDKTVYLAKYGPFYDMVE